MGEPQPSVMIVKTKSISLRKAHAKIQEFVQEHQIHDDFLSLQSLREVEVKVSEEVLEKLSQVQQALEEELSLDSTPKQETKKRKKKDDEDEGTTGKKKRAKS